MGELDEFTIVDDDSLWEAICACEGKAFCTARGLAFTYSIKGGEMFVTRKEKSKSLTKSSVLMAFHEAQRLQREVGYVSGPKKLGTFGASYLYPIFLALGVIRSSLKDSSRPVYFG